MRHKLKFNYRIFNGNLRVRETRILELAVERESKLTYSRISNKFMVSFIILLLNRETCTAIRDGLCVTEWSEAVKKYSSNLMPEFQLLPNCSLLPSVANGTNACSFIELTTSDSVMSTTSKLETTVFSG